MPTFGLNCLGSEIRKFKNKTTYIRVKAGVLKLMTAFRFWTYFWTAALLQEKKLDLIMCFL